MVSAFVWSAAIAIGGGSGYALASRFVSLRRAIVMRPAKLRPPEYYVRCPKDCGRWTLSGTCWGCHGLSHSPCNNDWIPPADAMPKCRACGSPVFTLPREDGCCKACGREIDIEVGLLEAGGGVQ